MDRSIHLLSCGPFFLSISGKKILPPVSSQSFPLGADGADGDYAFSAGDGADAVV